LTHVSYCFVFVSHCPDEIVTKPPLKNGHAAKKNIAERCAAKPMNHRCRSISKSSGKCNLFHNPKPDKQHFFCRVNVVNPYNRYKRNCLSAALISRTSHEMRQQKSRREKSRRLCTQGVNSTGAYFFRRSKGSAPRPRITSVAGSGISIAD